MTWSNLILTNQVSGHRESEASTSLLGLRFLLVSVS
jgi:hypothetical protein